ncbi:MAG: cytochrome b/b6 domain-containing protein [Proteobacteria bacterium]|nr:cytochrome b/b6 domain-containing protein [Pseudomonadota bacterium]
MSNRVYVWDRYVRFFHWTLVAAFTFAYLSGEEETPLHFYAGYLICALLVSRVIWGFIGSRHARFTDFVTPPSAALGYLKSLAGGPIKHYRGHNPAGGWMVLMLLASLTLTVGCGLRTLALEGEGPFAIPKLAKPDATTMSESEIVTLKAARKARRDEEHLWKEIHEFGANTTLALVGLHVLGVVASSLRHRQNLARAMVTGYKDEPESPV